MSRYSRDRRCPLPQQTLPNELVNFKFPGREVQTIVSHDYARSVMSPWPWLWSSEVNNHTSFQLTGGQRMLSSILALNWIWEFSCLVLKAGILSASVSRFNASVTVQISSFLGSTSLLRNEPSYGVEYRSYFWIFGRSFQQPEAELF